MKFTTDYHSEPGVTCHMAIASNSKFPLDFLSLFYVFITQQGGLHSFPTDNCIPKVLEKSEE